MLSRKVLARASLSTIVCVLAASASAQDTFKSSKLMEYSAEARTGYITSSVIMASLIAAENSERHAACIRGWVDREIKAGYTPILDAMRRFPDHHPSGVILAVLNRACGPFKYHGN